MTILSDSKVCRHTSAYWYPESEPRLLRGAIRCAGLQIESGVTRVTGFLFYLVIPAHDCRDAEGRAKQDARAEAGIQNRSRGV